VKNILAFKKQSIRRLQIWYFWHHFWYRSLTYEEKGGLYLKLAWIGVAVPFVMPHTPFFILAVLNFVRAGNNAMAERIMSHPLYGKAVRDWVEHRRMSWKSKLIALIGIIISITISIGVAILLNFLFNQIRYRVGVIPLFLGATAIIYLLFRRSRRP
jgi:uncharacterized membrane protein YbaN (DUF454 family)